LFVNIQRIGRLLFNTLQIIAGAFNKHNSLKQEVPDDSERNKHSYAKGSNPKIKKF
jgi:hypothetical protein